MSLEEVKENFEYIVENAEKYFCDLIDYVSRMYVHGRYGRG